MGYAPFNQPQNRTSPPPSGRGMAEVHPRHAGLSEYLQACYALSYRGTTPRHSRGAAMKKKSKKLVLAKETVRELMDPDRLKDAAGGQPTIAPTCGVSCIPFETCVRC